MIQIIKNRPNFKTLDYKNWISKNVLTSQIVNLSVNYKFWYVKRGFVLKDMSRNREKKKMTPQIFIDLVIFLIINET